MIFIQGETAAIALNMLKNREIFVYIKCNNVLNT